MTNFFKKLNTLIQAQVNDVLRPLKSEEEQTGKTRKAALARRQIRQGLEGDTKALRERVNDAYAYQEGLQARIAKLYQEVERWDVFANQAVADGRDADARMALSRLQQLQRDIVQAEDALREHQQVTQELVRRVEMLEAIVAQSREEDAAASSAPIISDDPDAQAGVQLGERIARQLDQTRQKLSELVQSYRQEREDAPAAQDVAPPAAAQPEDAPPSTVKPNKTDDELAERLRRLSKPE